MALMGEASLGGDILVLAIFLWFIGALGYGLFEFLREVFAGRQARGRGAAITAAGIKSVALGVAAVLAWLALYAFLRWFRRVGWIGYLAFAIPMALLLSFVAKRSVLVRKGLPAAVEWLRDLMEDKAGWIVGLWLALFYGGILYFLLFAPHGVLCVLGLKPCGSW